MNGINRAQNQVESASSVYVGKVIDGDEEWDRVRIGVLGAPFHLGQNQLGTEKAPLLIRQTGVLKKLLSLGHEIKDFGDLFHKEVNEEDFSFQSGTLAYPANNIEYCRQLSAVVERISSSGHVVLTLGGDHSIGLATVHGQLRCNEDTCVLWIDAHGDINTPDSSDTGHMHGMPLSFNLVEMDHQRPKWPEMHWFKPLLKASQLAFIGLRDVDPQEKEFFNLYRIPFYSMREVDEYGIREVVKMALKAINPNGNRPLHVSFDIDALDPLEAPATGTPVRGGLTLREGQTILEDCFASGNLRGLDLVEVNCDLGTKEEGQRTLAAAKHLIAAAFGYYRGGRVLTA